MIHSGTVVILRTIVAVVFDRFDRDCWSGAVLKQRNVRLPEYTAGHMRIDDAGYDAPSVRRCTMVPVSSEKDQYSTHDRSTHLRISDISAISHQHVGID